MSVKTLKYSVEVCARHPNRIIRHPAITLHTANCPDCDFEKHKATDTRKIGDTLAVCDLKLGDTVSTFEGAYNAATVSRVAHDGEVTTMRPYAIHGDFSYCDGRVIVTFGAEKNTYSRDSHVTFKLLQKGGYIR